MADAAPTSATAPPPPRPRRVWRKLFRTLLVLLVVLAVLIWFLPTIIARTGLLNSILARAGADLNGTVTADDASLGWFSTIELRGVKIADADGQPVLTATSVTTSRTLYQLLMDRADLGTFTVNEPVLQVIVADERTNIENLIQKYLDDPTPARPDRTPVVVELRAGQIAVREEPARTPKILNAVEVSLRIPRSRDEAVTLKSSFESQDGDTSGQLELTAEFLHGGKLSIVSTDFPTASLSPVIRRFDLSADVAGQLGAKVEVAWKSQANQPLTLTVDGTAAASNVRLRHRWLGPDELRLQSLSVPCKLNYANGILAVEQSSLECEVGRVEFAGTFDPTADPEKLAEQTGLTLKAQVDVAKLSKLLPHVLYLRADTEILAGSVALDITSTRGPNGPRWIGTLKTSRLEAVRARQPVVWESPLAVAFVGRLRNDKLPNFENLEIRSDFLTVNATGEPEAFNAAARVDLGTLANKIGQFVDLGAWKLTGAAVVRLHANRKNDGDFQLGGTIIVEELALSDGGSLNLKEPNVAMNYKADAGRGPGGLLRLDRGEIGITAGTDKLSLTLKKPVADVRTANSGEAALTLIGDLARWRSRFGEMIGFPADWALTGNGTIMATLQLDTNSYRAAPLNWNLADAVFRIPNMLDLNEKQLMGRAAELRYDRKDRTVTFADSEITCITLGATVPKVVLMPLPGGGYGATAEAKILTRLDRLQRTLMLGWKDGSDALSGTAEGRVSLDAGTANRFGFVADLELKNFAYGTPAKPLWSEPSAKVKTTGMLDVAADTLQFQSAKVERDGVVLDGSGRITKLSTLAVADLSGTITADLKQVEPTLQEYIGKTAKVSGSRTKPFRLTGPLNGGDVALLGGEVTVGWQQVQAYGFDVGPGELGATLKDGIIYMSTVEAMFGGGKVKLTPAASMKTGERFLNFAKGRIIDNAKLTPAACADAVGYALPAIANSAKADGQFSFDLQDNRIPFASPATTATIRGNLTVHEANVSPGPIVTQVLQALGVQNTTVTLSRENVVPVEFKNGRVHHRDFTMTIDGVVVRTAGSVGTDGTVKMDVEVPLKGKLADLLLSDKLLGKLPNSNRVREELAKQTVRIPVGGTLARPALDVNGVRGQIARVVADTAKASAVGTAQDALRKGADDLLKKGLDGLFPKK